MARVEVFAEPCACGSAIGGFVAWRALGVYLASAGVFAWLTFSDDWHAIINNGTAVTALSIASGILIRALLITVTRTRR